MTDPQITIHSTKDSDNPDERAALRERAKLLGITHSPNISNALLRDRISAKLNDTPDPGEPGVTDLASSEDPYGKPDDDDSPAVMDDVAPEQIAQRLQASASNVKTVNGSKPLTKKQQIQAEREKQWAEQLRLVRVKIACLNPSKKELKGEIISVSNKFLGTVKKFVPFGEVTDNGYHIPFVIYTELLGRQFQHITVEKKNGTSLPKHQLVREFAIELLPDLTPDQLANLARTQAVAANQ